MASSSPDLPRPPRAVLLTAAAGAFAVLGCGASPARARLDRAHEVASRRLEAQAPIESTTADADALVASVVAKSPALASLAFKARALVHGGRSEAVRPSPELGFEAWNLPMTEPYRLREAEMYMLELRLRFPAPAALEGRALAMAEEAETTLAELAAEERAVAERATELVADFLKATEEARLLRAQRTLVDRMGQATRARYATGGAALAEAARVELERTRIDRAIVRAEADAAIARGSLDVALHRNAESPIALDRSNTVPRTIALPLAELAKLSAEHRPRLAAAAGRVRAAAARRSAAEAETQVPETMLGLGYWQHPGMRAGVGLTASMSLPWLEGPQTHRLARAREEAEAEREAEEAERREGTIELAQAHARVRAIEAEILVLRARA